MKRALPLVLLLLAAASWSDDTEPVLARLLGVANDKQAVVGISAKPGAVGAPAWAQLPQSWHLLPGEAIEAKQRPADRAIELFHGKGVERSLLARVEVRYFAAPDKRWVPHFQLQEVPLVARDAAGNWRPITAPAGAPGLIMLTGTALPNADGYYAHLEFSIGAGRTAIEGWVVH